MFGTGYRATPGCAIGTVLTTISNPSCSIMCDTEAGFLPGSGTYSCSLTGGAPTSSLICEPANYAVTVKLAYADSAVAAEGLQSLAQRFPAPAPHTQNDYVFSVQTALRNQGGDNFQTAEVKWGKVCKRV